MEDIRWEFSIFSFCMQNSFLPKSINEALFCDDFLGRHKIIYTNGALDVYKRPGLDIDYILVYKLSRFGRNAADILNSLELVQSYGVNLICIEEGIDSSQTSGKLLISVLAAVAESERENIIEQTMNGRREKARQGGWNGGFAPYGYTLEDNKPVSYTHLDVYKRQECDCYCTECFQRQCD